MCLHQSFCPAETFVTADKSVSRSPNISYMQPLCAIFENDEACLIGINY